jgi:hypothetical protein
MPQRSGIHGANVDPLFRGPDWMPITPKRGSFLHADSQERARRGIRSLTVDVSEGDLQAMVERGYEGAASTDHDQQAQAVGMFLNDALLQI